MKTVRSAARLPSGGAWYPATLRIRLEPYFKGVNDGRSLQKRRTN